MKKYLQDYVITKLIDTNNRKLVIWSVGFATFFFGFFAGAIYNVYLLWMQDPLVLQFRASLSYKSAIFGDGIILPIMNMVVALFLFKYKRLVKKSFIQLAIVLGIGITLYFHITQATGGIINWAMPSPWHWNILGVWHAAYMFSVASFLSLFYLVVFNLVRKEKVMPKELFLVTFGLVLFFMLLRFDYIAIDLKSLIPSF